MHATDLFWYPLKTSENLVFWCFQGYQQKRSLAWYRLVLKKNLSKLKKYYDYDDIEYRGIRDVINLFNLSIDEDYYKPIIINSSFNDNYIEYESKGDFIN